MITIRLLFLAAALALVGACATSPRPPAEKPGGREQALIEMRAVVIGVDQKHRLLALEGDDGGRVVLPVAAEFRDFERARVGDQVVVSFTQAIAWQVKPSGEGSTGMSTRESLSNPKPGEAPGGTIERALTITARISALDPARGTVTLSGPQGRSETLKVNKPADLETLRVGDLVDITYSEALAVGVREVTK